MGYEIDKTEHNGPKGRGGAWLGKVEAKLQASRVRRIQGREIVRDETVYVSEDECDCMRVGCRGCDDEHEAE